MIVSLKTAKKRLLKFEYNHTDPANQLAHDLVQTLEAKEKEIERLRGALGFYANEENYFDKEVPYEDGNGTWVEPCSSNVYEDSGFKARQALEGETDAVQNHE